MPDPTVSLSRRLEALCTAPPPNTTLESHPSTTTHTPRPETGPTDPRHSAPQTALAYARAWRGVDAEGQVLGRLATRIAIVLMGKHKPVYDQASKPVSL